MDFEKIGAYSKSTICKNLHKLAAVEVT